MLLKIKKNLSDFNNISQFHVVSSVLLVLTVFFEQVLFDFSFSGFLHFILISYLLKTYFLSLKKLQYTYWTLSILLLSYSIIHIFDDSIVYVIPFIGFTSLKLIEMYLVSTPVYYPWFNWWEYDFRYRNDLKAFVSFNNRSQEARITDIRRGAACITLFEKLPIGSSILVNMNESKNALTIEGKIISVRETSLGRGFSYGVSFSWENDLTREYYGQMKSSWNQARLENKRDRVESTNSNIH